jgi:transposase
MKYIGIDIGKRFHVACVLDDTHTAKPIQFSSLGSGYEKLLDYLTKHEVTTESSIIGLEATGHYWLTIFQKLKADGWKVFVLNPLQVQSFRNEKIRGSKTDELDSELIAKVMKFGVGRETAMPSEELFQLKQLTRFRWDLVQRLSSIKLEVISVLDTVFPEYETVFKGLFGKTSLMVLSEYTLPDEIASLDVEKLSALLEKNSRKKFGRKHAEKLQQTARDTFGLRFGMSAFSLELKLLLSQIRHLQKQKETVETTITKLVKKQKTTLVTIPGIGYITAGTILGETVGFYKKQEKDPRSLLAFAGLDPVLKQSGQFTGKTKMSKRGSPYLRYALMQSALVATNCDEGFKKIYQRYKGQGKHHRVALSHVATKLTFVVHSVMRTNKAYVPILEYNKKKA